LKLLTQITAEDLLQKIEKLLALVLQKVRSIDAASSARNGAPVCTVNGIYTSQAWTEWTLGFQYGSAVLAFDGTGDWDCLRIALRNLQRMEPHLTHTGVHDHGFTTMSTFGNLYRLLHEGMISDTEISPDYCALAIKVSGAVQAARWTSLREGEGFIYSFNGRHSLFIDTIRTLRVLALAHQLGQTLLAEGDAQIDLLLRLAQHLRTTMRYAIFRGEARDVYDEPGRIAHESLFNIDSGRYRCPSTQQGYSPFTTWMRGLAWAILGLAEQLEFLDSLPFDEKLKAGGEAFIQEMISDAIMLCDYYLGNTPADGIPYWDSGAPGLARMGDYLNEPADPFNPHEPVDSSAACIAAQGFLRLGKYLQHIDRPVEGNRYFAAGLYISASLFDEPYLSVKEEHQGLILHSVYHRPRGWDQVHEGQKIPTGESSMWGDYHALELAVYILRLINNEPYLKFFI
jgi:unsaturated chondroitin disaccharide hydrolase